MSVLVSGAEPRIFLRCGPYSGVPESYGADFLIAGESLLLGVQRKQFPGDLISSLSDGRLATSSMKLAHLPFRLLVLEGEPKWTRDGTLMDYDYGQGAKFTRDQLRRLQFSLLLNFQIGTMWTKAPLDTVALIESLNEWAQKGDHDSLLTRPGVVGTGTARQRDTDRDRGVYLLQGFDGIGPKVAGDIYDHFGGVPLSWSCGPDELLEVKGVGKGRRDKLVGLLDPVLSP